MCNKSIIYGAAAMLLATVSCTSHYQLCDVSRSRILIDSRYDAHPDQQAVAFLAPYKHQVDSVMSPIVGRVACDMYADRPESKLSNLIADIMVWSGKVYNEHPVLGIYNIGGIRAAFAKGDITYGDVLDVAPFENKVCFVTLSGSKVIELFQQIAKVGGEAVSHGVELEMTADGQLKKALLNGKPIDPTAQYRVATNDYVAQGNDKLAAFKSATDINSPQGKENNVRFIIIEYAKQLAKEGKMVDAQIEGRIKTVKP